MDGGGTIPGLCVLLGSAYPTGQECLSSTVWDPLNSRKRGHEQCLGKSGYELNSKDFPDYVSTVEIFKCITNVESLLKSNSQIIFFEIIIEMY